MMLFRPLILLILRVFYGFDASAIKHMKANGRTLIIANHVSLIDGLLLMAALPFSATVVVNTLIARHALYKRIVQTHSAIY